MVVDSSLTRTITYKAPPGRRKGFKVKKKVKYLTPWDEIREHVRLLALEKGASASIVGIYKEVLKLDRTMKKSWQISGDEIARRNLIAERELVEGGYIEEQ